MIEFLIPPSGISITIDHTVLEIRSYNEDTLEPLRVDAYLNGKYLDTYIPDSDGYMQIPLTFTEYDNEVLISNNEEEEIWYCTYVNGNSPPDITSVTISPKTVNAKGTVKIVVEVS